VTSEPAAGAPRRRFLLVGLTGGIATGKSTVSRMLAHLGARIIDADQLARDVVMPGQPAHAAVVAEFGREVLQEDGYLDRKKLGAIVFADPARRKRLEAITHPAVRARFQRILAVHEEEAFEGLVIWDVPLLIEGGGHRQMDQVVVVVTDEATQLARLMARDGSPEAEARARIASQMPVAEKAKLADHVIDNSGDRAATERRVREVYQALLAELRRRLAAAPAPGPH
jgi:dephospho-CoA kinase